MIDPQARGSGVPTVIGHHAISRGKDHCIAASRREEFFGPLGVADIRTFARTETELPLSWTLPTLML
jgi:hypothetical protein